MKSNNEQESLLLTMRQAAKALQLSDRTVWSMIQRGELPCVRLGRSVRIDPADLQQFIEKAKEGQGVQQ